MRSVGNRSCTILAPNRPVLKDTFARRLNRWWNKIAGADIAIRRMEAAEEKHEAEFREQRDRALAGEEDVRDFLRESAIEEKAHARALNAMVAPPGPRTALDAILKRERWHGRGGSWVADAIYGANDGLGAVFGIVSGVAGATNNQQHFVLISGLAGMLASTLSMGAGAYLAAKSEAEVYEAEISREKAEVEENPEEEIEEMSLFYQLQGFSRGIAANGGTSRRATGTIRASDGSERARIIRTSLSESVDIRDVSRHLDGNRRFRSDHSVLLHGRTRAVIASFGISLIAHFAVGAVKSLITIRSWWTSGLEMTWIGVIVAAVTYGLGLAFGAIT